MEKTSNQGQSEQLKDLIGQFLDVVKPAFNPTGEIEGYHALFTFLDSVKSENPADVLEKLTLLSDNFKKTSEKSGYFESDRPDCEVYLTSNGESIQLKMVALVSEEEDSEDIKLLGENCKSSFIGALDFIHQASK